MRSAPPDKTPAATTTMEFLIFAEPASSVTVSLTQPLIFAIEVLVPARILFALLALLSLTLAGCSRDKEGQPGTEQMAAPDRGGAPIVEADIVEVDMEPTGPAPSAAAIAFAADCDAGIAEAGEIFDALESSEGPHTVDTTLERYNDLGIALYNGYAKASLYANAHPDETVREAGRECEQRFDEFNTRLSLSRPVYDAISAIDVSGEDEATRFFHEKQLRDFRRAGVDKDEATREEITALRESLLKLGQQFSKNIAEDVRSIELDSADRLEGLPQDFIDAHPPNDAGKIVITTNYPDYFPFSRYARDDAARKALTVQYMNRGYPENEPILEQLIEKRDRLAQILGYPRWAAYVTEDKMVGSAENAGDFIDKVAGLAKPRADAETEVLVARLRQDYPDVESVGIWQRSFVDNLVREEQFEVDNKLIRQYFAYERVRDGIFSLISELFDVRITPWQTEVWDPGVESYELRDGDELIGRFYLDMHPRDGKFKHAAAFPIVPGIAGRQIPVAALMCNFPGGDGSPGLMEHSQVNTFLHEFGHLIHFLFAGDHRWVGNSGIAAEWDFVEAPSQMLEEWIYDKDTLQSFGLNENGEPIPDELVARMNAARKFGRGVGNRQQMFYAAVSLNYYNRDPDSFDLLPMMKKLQAEYSPYDYLPDTHFYASFGHLDGYSAIYYTYAWSKVIALDMFSRFEQEGIRNTKTARDYRDKVLAVGGARPAAESVEDFLGRPYNFEAFAESLAAEGESGPGVMR